MSSTAQAPDNGAGDDVRYFFIKRPVLAIVISVIVTLLGVFAIRLLPISRYPQITPPAVQVQATFPGATADRCNRMRIHVTTGGRVGAASETTRRSVRVVDEV